jgi:xanthine dehydrogenase accessory factor
MAADGAPGQWPRPTPVAAVVQPDWPVGGLVEDVVDDLARVGATGRPCVLATLARVEGSAPRRPGSQMLIQESGEHLGYVAGGCVEAAVAAEAMALFTGPERRLLVLGQGSPFVDIRLPCGSRVEIVLERINPGDAAVARLIAARRARREAVWLSGVAAPSRACVSPAANDGPLAPRFARIVDASRDAPPDGGGLDEDGAVLWRRHVPRLRLFLVGGDPVVLAVARLALACGYEVVVDRPLGPAHGPSGFGFHYDRRAPADAARAWTLDPWTAVVAATHDAGLDHDALAQALRGSCFYVGALGSRGRVDARRDRLAAEGVDAERLARLHAPVGLPIGAATPNEIALAILADITAAWRGSRPS